jgi:hypothetical protein
MRGRRSFALVNPPRGQACRLERAELTIERNGGARFTAVVPGVDLSAGAAPSVLITVVAGDRCAEGNVIIPPVVNPQPRPPAHVCN